MPSSPGPALAPALLLTEIRAFLRRTHLVAAAVFFGVLYGLASLLAGGMLDLYPAGGGTAVEVVLGSGTGQSWWLYPGVIVYGPWGVLALPFFTTIAMVAVAAGVGVGMAVAAGLIVRLVRPTPDDVARSKAVGAATGLTPAMIGLVTIGSCCTTTAAATGGVGLIAQASGTTTANLVLNNWYLGVAQVAIVWAALLGQELLLTVYGGLLGVRATGASRPRRIPPPLDRRWVAGALLRGTLAVGGILWSLSMFADWTTHAPATATAGWWVRWLLQHQLIAALAVGAAFFPDRALRGFRALGAGPARLVLAAFAAVALSVLVWIPAPIAGSGLDNLSGQLLGVVGLTGVWGAVPVGAVSGIPLYVRWALEYVLPSGFVLVAAIAPERAFGPLLATVARVEPAPDLQTARPLFEPRRLPGPTASPASALGAPGAGAGSPDAR